MRVIRPLSILAALVALAAVAASPAASRSGDRNNDRIPDRWERAHGLSLKVNQARRDRDRDGLNNRGEFRAQTNPRDADSDNDGIKDGDENAGTIASFDNNVLTITLAGGGTVAGTVTDQTRIECETGPSASASHGGSSGPGGGDRDDDDDNSGPSGNSGPGSADDGSQGDDDGEHGDCGKDDQLCTTAALTVGAVVEEAELKTRNGTLVYKEIELD